MRKVKAEEVKALRREISIHRALAHPNIVRLINAFERDGKLFIFLESLRTNLFEYMQPRTFDEESALRFFREVVRSVAFLHSRKLVHRDIKPENVLLDQQRRVKLCDFGFAAAVESGEKRDTFCGTQQYLPPEIVLGHEQSLKVDIWCLGVLLFELLHKRVPFPNKNIQTYLESVGKRNIQFLASVSLPVRRLITACLDPDPSKRPSASQLLADPLLNEGTPRFQQRASSVITADRGNRQNPKVFGYSPIKAELPTTNNVLQRIGSPVKPSWPVLSDKAEKLPIDDWFGDTYVKKPVVQTVSQSRPPPLNFNKAESQPPTTGSGFESPVKIQVYKNTTFGPENFLKRTAIEPPFAFFSDNRASQPSNQPIQLKPVTQPRPNQLQQTTSTRPISPILVTHSNTSPGRSTQPMTFFNSPTHILTRPSDPGLRSSSPFQSHVVTLSPTSVVRNSPNSAVVTRTASLVGSPLQLGSPSHKHSRP